MTVDMKPVCYKMAQGVNEEVFPGGVLLVSVGDTLVCHNAFGVKDIFTKNRVEKNSVFDLASLTKPLATAMAVAKLIEKKHLKLNQSIGEFIPAAQGTDKCNITLESLLRHCSGLPAHRPYYTKLVSIKPEKRQEVLCAMLLQEPLVYEPDTREIYSDLGYMLLARIVEIVSRKRFDAFVLENVFHPLGVKSLFFGKDTSGEQYAATAYDFESIVSTEKCPWRKKILRGEVHDDNAWSLGGVAGHAGLFGTAPGVWKILKDLLKTLNGRSGGIISPDLLSSFLEKRQGRERVAGFDTPSKSGASCGKYFSSSAIGHLGFTGTSFWIDPRSNLIVILLTNRVHPNRNNVKIRAFRPEIHDLIYEQLFFPI